MGMRESQALPNSRAMAATVRAEEVWHNIFYATRRYLDPQVVKTMDKWSICFICSQPQRHMEPWTGAERAL